MLTTHVVSQGLAEEMKKAGWPQEGSTFYWVNGELWDETMQSDYETPATPPRSEWVARPLASELGEMLPDNVHSGGVSACLTIQKTAGNFWTAEYVEPDGSVLHESAGAWLPDALAALWLHLKKKDY